MYVTDYQPTPILPTLPAAQLTRPKTTWSDKESWWARPWREYGYLFLVALLDAVFGIVAWFLIAASLPNVLFWREPLLSFLFTIIGLLVLSFIIVHARKLGSIYRSLDARLLGEYVAPPPELDLSVPETGLRGYWRKLKIALTDGSGWRALLFTLISIPLGVGGLLAATFAPLVGLAALTYPLWWSFIDGSCGPDSGLIRGLMIRCQVSYSYRDVLPDGTFNPNDMLEVFSYRALNTLGDLVVVFIMGLALLALTPAIIHGVTTLFRLLTRALLGTSPGAEKIAELRKQRAAVVNDSDARLRQLERDLHDGTQAQLTAIAMQISEARELLANGENPELAMDLLAKAQQNTQDAASELRGITQGIHPAALDTGLGVALQSLVNRSAIPTDLHVGDSVESPPLDPAVRSIAYYTIAELVSNAAKHSDATQVRVRVNRLTSAGLHIDVTDNGKGGAQIVERAERDDAGQQTGLAGLSERLAAVDGGMSISSPTGGPTSIDVWLPTKI